MKDITGNLPSIDDLLRAIQNRRGTSNSNDLLPSLALFGAGLLVGAGLALLLPRRRARSYARTSASVCMRCATRSTARRSTRSRTEAPGATGAALAGLADRSGDESEAMECGAAAPLS